MWSRMWIKSLGVLQKLRPKTLTHKQTEWDKFITDKFKYFGFNSRVAYALAALNVVGYAAFYLMCDKDSYYRRFALDSHQRTRFFNYLTCHFANNNLYTSAATISLLLLSARKIELLFGSAFLLKLTFLSMCMNVLTFHLSKNTMTLLPPNWRLPIDQVSAPDDRFHMGPHSLVATYCSFLLLKLFKLPIVTILALGVGDTLVSQHGFWGGYLAGLLAFTAF
jgi:hypothetical protein